MSELKEYLCIEAKMIEREDFLCYRFTSATKSAPKACMEIVYLKSEVDEAIAELKAKLDKAIAERDGNQVCLDALNKKLEDVQATAYAESVDAGMRERKLKRALWRAIALFCARSCEYFSGIMSHCLMGQDDLYRLCEEKKNKYLNATYKCRAKMEEYK